MSSLARLRPYLFERDFDADACLDIAGTDEAQPVPPMFTEADLEEARAAAFTAGHDAGRIAAEAAAEARLGNAVEALNAQIAVLATEISRGREELGRQAAALATALCRKILPGRYREGAADDIAALVAQVLPAVADAPLITVRVAESLSEPLRACLQEVSCSAGFPGTLQVLGDPALIEGDCRIEWAHGGLSREANHLWQRIQALLDETLGLPAPAPSPFLGVPAPSGATPSPLPQ